MKILIFIVSLLFVACSYKPISVIAKDMLMDSVFVDVIVLKSDPANSVAVKDGVRQAVVKRLNANLTDKNNAKTIIIADIQSVNFSPISYDEFGYITSYEAEVMLLYKIKFGDGSIQNITCTGTSSFRTSKMIDKTFYTDSVISNKDRYTAISQASEESFDELIAKLALYLNKE